MTHSGPVSSGSPFGKGWLLVWVLAAVCFGFGFYLFIPEPTDLAVYRWGGDAILTGDALYGLAEARQNPIPIAAAVELPFTYPPFAAVVFVPAALIAWPLTVIGLVAMSFLALARTVWLLLAASNREAPAMGVFVGTFLVCLVLEPTLNTFGFGQVNLILLWLVVEDIFGDRPSWLRGIPTGLAAAIKLTPGIFLLMYLVVGSWRRFIAGTATFVVSLLVPVVFIGWDQVVAFWTTILWDPGRVGGPAYSLNQSLNGLLWRVFAEEPPTILWAVVAVGVLVVALTVARREWDRWRICAFATVALAMLIVSPISWTHHWVWAIPALILLLGLRLRLIALGLLVAGIVLFVAQAPMWVPRSNEAEYEWIWWQEILGNSYIIWACITMIYLVAISLSSYQASNTADGRDSTPTHAEEPDTR